MSKEISKKVVEDIYGDRFVSLKDDVSKIISGKAVSVLEDMKSHVAKKFFSINEADSDDKSWDRTLDYARQGRSAPTVATPTGKEYSGVGATRRFGQDLTSGRSSVRDDATRARVSMDSEKSLDARGTPGLANRSAETGTGRREVPRNTAGPGEPGYIPPNAPTGRPTSVVGGRPAQPAPAARPAQSQPAPAPAARPAPAAGSQGVTGDELARTSGGAFANRANRMDQGLVNRTLGRSDLKAGSAEANLALRDYYRAQQRTGSQNQQSSDDNAVHGPSADRMRAAAVSPEARQRAAERDISNSAQRAADERDAADATDSRRNYGQAPGQER